MLTSTMLTSIGSAATKRLVAASSSRIVISQVRGTAYGPLRKLNLFQPSLNVTRGYAAQQKKRATATAKKSQKTTTAKKGTKVATKAKATPKAKATAKPKATIKARTKTRAKAKPAPKKPKSRKKSMSDEEKAALERKTLKAKSLFTEPKRLPDSKWQLYVTEMTKSKLHSPTELRDGMSKLSESYKSLPASEHQRLDETSQQNKLQNAAAYKAWVESHTPAEIAAANSARLFLKRKYGHPKGIVKRIMDERQPKRPASAYTLYNKARWSSGEFSVGTGGIGASATKLAGEWKNLSDSEKQPYADLAKSDFERYVKEVESVLGRKVTPPRKTASAA